jgi:chromosome partitioning protein
MSGKVLTIAQQKGGSGKTTLAVNIAQTLVSQGKSVALLDTDPQGSLGRWFMARRDRVGAGAGLEFGTASAWGVSYECEKLRKLHDVVIIDTPPKIDADLRPALRESDLVLVPVAASQIDLWAIESVLELARRERRPALIVLNRITSRTRLTGDMIAKIDAMDTPRAATALGNRVAFAEAMGIGLSAAELGKSSLAAKEVAALVQDIVAILDAC